MYKELRHIFGEGMKINWRIVPGLVTVATQEDGLRTLVNGGETRSVAICTKFKPRKMRPDCETSHGHLWVMRIWIFANRMQKLNEMNEIDFN